MLSCLLKVKSLNASTAKMSLLSRTRSGERHLNPDYVTNYESLSERETLKKALVFPAYWISPEFSFDHERETREIWVLQEAVDFLLSNKALRL